MPNMPLPAERLALAEHFSNVAAGRYRRRCWWVSYDDMRQVGLLAACEAARTFEPEVGIDFRRYLWRAIVLAMQNEMWQASVVATGGTKHAHTKARAEAAGIAWQQRSDTDAPEHDDSGAPVARMRARLDDDAPPADAELYRRDWSSRVRARLVVLARGDEAVVQALLDDADAERVRSAGLAGILRMRAMGDAQLLALVQEKRDN